MNKTINILGDITSTPRKKSDVSLSGIMNELSGVNKGDDLYININSYGGEVFEAVAIAGILKDSGANLKFGVLGICASAANLLFDPNDNVQIARGAMVMNHWAQGEASGDSRELRRVAKLLDKINNEILLNNLNVRSSKSIEELTDLLNNEWWLSSNEAINILGFSDAGINAIENKYETKQENIYKNYLEKRKALNNDAFKQFTNFKNSLKK